MEGSSQKSGPRGCSWIPNCRYGDAMSGHENLNLYYRVVLRAKFYGHKNLICYDWWGANLEMMLNKPQYFSVQGLYLIKIQTCHNGLSLLVTMGLRPLTSHNLGPILGDGSFFNWCQCLTVVSTHITLITLHTVKLDRNWLHFSFAKPHWTAKSSSGYKKSSCLICMPS